MSCLLSTYLLVKPHKYTPGEEIHATHTRLGTPAVASPVNTDAEETALRDENQFEEVWKFFIFLEKSLSQSLRHQHFPGSLSSLVYQERLRLRLSFMLVFNCIRIKLSHLSSTFSVTVFQLVSLKRNFARQHDDTITLTEDRYTIPWFLRP